VGNNADRHRVTRGLSNSFRRLLVVLVSAVRRVTVIVWLPGVVKGLLHLPYFPYSAVRVLLGIVTGLLQFTVLSVLYCSVRVCIRHGARYYLNCGRAGRVQLHAPATTVGGQRGQWEIEASLRHWVRSSSVKWA